MNRVLNAGTTLLYNVGSFLTTSARQTVSRLALTPPFLSHILWLLSQKFLDLAKEGYGSNAAVFAVMRVLMTSVAEPPLKTYQRQDDGEPDLTKPLDWKHPLTQLIRQPNPWLTEYEHYEIITLHLGITGRYTAWKERNNAGQVMAIWPLRPDRVGPVYGNQMEGEPLLLGWSYLVPGTMHYIGIPADDVLMLNFPDPTGESGGLVEGLGPLQALAIEVGADLTASRFVGHLLANHAQPGVVIQLKRGLRNKDDAMLIKEAFIREFGGSRVGTPAVIDEDSTIQPLGFSLRDLEFPQLRRVSESRIAGAFGVPAILASLLVGLEASSTNATVDEIRAFFTETTLTGTYWKRFADAFTYQLASEWGEDFVCQFDLTKVAALAGRSSMRLGEIRDGFDRGVVKVKEYREQLGLADDGTIGDVFMYGIAPGRGAQTVVDPATVTAENAAANTVQTDEAAKPESGSAAPSAKALTDGHTSNGHGAKSLHDELAAWQAMASIAVGLGKPQPLYDSHHLDPVAYWSLCEGLSGCQNEDDVNRLFTEAATALDPALAA